MEEDDTVSLPLTISFVTPGDAHIETGALASAIKKVHPLECDYDEDPALTMLSHELIWQPNTRVSIVDMEHISAFDHKRPIPGRAHLPEQERIDTSKTDNIALRETIKDLDSESTILALVNAMPGHVDWDILYEKFPKITRLVYVAGFHEEFTDTSFPEGWKLDALALVNVAGSSACIPQVLSGQVKAMVLYYCCNIQFGDRIESRGRSPPMAPPTAHPMSSNLGVRSLAVYENDVLDMLTLTESVQPDMMHNLTDLTVVSMNGLDLACSDNSDVLGAMSRLTGLKKLTIVTTIVKEINIFRELLGAVPQQLEELRIQGQTSEEDDEVLPKEWIDGFAQGTILPRLRTLNFKYGFDKEKKEAEGEGKEDSVDEKALRVEKLVEEAATKRGITFSRESIPHPP